MVRPSSVIYYILDHNNQVVPAIDVVSWAKWFETNLNKRRVAFDRVGKIDISTVFLGIDHNWGDGKPLLFETMVFDDSEDCERCSTWEEAVEQHARAVKRAKEPNNG